MAVFAITNLVLGGGQYLWHYAESQRLDTLKSQLDAEQPHIRALEARLQQMETELTGLASQIEALKAEIGALEKAHPHGIPEDRYAAYTKSAQHHNELAQAHNQKVTEQQTVYADYVARVDRFNAVVDEANALAQRIGGTRHVLPMSRARR